MAKIMLVEDDTNLSEIYQARLTAEGYDIVSAHDGEEALALAAKEKPDLIVSDVMMPKISGFEMLDILRNTEGLKATKVIMLTALGQADDKTRADSLGADRYLVKSQVTLEDIVKAAQELLTGETAPTPAAAAPADAAAPAPTPVAAPVPAPTPVAVAMPPAPAPAPVPEPMAAPVAPVSTPVVPSVPVAAPPVNPAPVAPAPVAAPPAPPMPVSAAPVATPPAPVAPVEQPMAPPAPAPTPVAAPVPAPTPVAVAMPPAPAPAPVPEPMAAPVAPVSTPVVPPVNPTAAADDKLVADAVEDLMEGAQPQTPPTAPAPAADTAPITSDSAEASTQTDNDTSNDNVNIGHKKVIKPITDGISQDRPSLDALLADEERKNPGSTGAPAATSNPAPNTPVTNVPHQPGHIITPSAADGLNNGNGLDPNSIALYSRHGIITIELSRRDCYS